MGARAPAVAARRLSGLAFEVLGGLAAAWTAAGDERHDRRAAALRLELPFEAASRRAADEG